MQYEPFLRFSEANDYLTYKYLLYRPFYDFDIAYKFSQDDFSPKPKARIILAKISKKNKPDLLLSDLELYMDYTTYLFNKKSKIALEKIGKLFTLKQLERLKSDINLKDDTLFTSLKYEEILHIYKVFSKYSLDIKKKIVSGLYLRKVEEDKSIEHQNWSTKKNW